jgi:amino acid transporter
MSKIYTNKKLSLVEVLGISIAILSPTISLSFNTVFATKAAGIAAPLSFLIGTGAILLVAFCFISFERRVMKKGSVYAYIRDTFGARYGYIAGWTLLLFYASLSSCAAALTGTEAMALLDDARFRHPSWWLLCSLVVILITTWLCWRDTKLAVRGMLVLEGASILIILILVVRILTSVPLSLSPFRPDPAAHGWSGIGYALIFTTLAFGGFEGAAAFSEETKDPRRNIPIALIATVLVSALFFGVSMYAQVLGFGPGNINQLVESNSPLSTLATHFISQRYALLIDAAVMSSAFACAMGTLSAASRMLMALSLDSRHRWFVTVDRKHGTPWKALLTVSSFSIVGTVIWGSRSGGVSYAAECASIGGIALIIVYLFVCFAELVASYSARSVFRIGVSALSIPLLVWPLYNTVYPAPQFPDNLWPYVVGAWVVAGVILSRKVRPNAAF